MKTTEILLEPGLVRINFPTGEVLTIEPAQNGAPVVEVRSRGFAALSIRPVVANVITLSIQDL